MKNRNICIPAGNVISAYFTFTVPKFIKPEKQTGSRRAGELYEKKTQGYLLRKLEENDPKDTRLEFSRWMCFRSEGDPQDRSRYCQPDCLIFNEWEKKITIVETKLQHCTEAYDQVRKLYEPVLKFMFPDYGICAIELCSWFDPHITFPEEYYLEQNIFEAQINRFGVHIWNPRYDRTDYSPASPTRQKISSPSLGQEG